jgi:hypothetical protein
MADAIPVTAVKALKDVRLTNGGKVVSLRRRPSFTPRKILGTQFC